MMGSDIDDPFSALKVDYLYYLDIVDTPYGSMHTNSRDHWTAVKGSTGVYFILFRISRVLLLQSALLHGFC